MDKKTKNILKYFLSSAAAVVLLYFSFREVDWSRFWLALKSCRWEFVLMSMMFGVLSFLFRSLRWRELLLPIDPSTSKITCFNAVNISYMVNLVLPRVGEFVRCGYITKNSKKGPDGRRLASVDKVFGTAVTDRLFDAAILMLLLATMLVLLWSRFGSFFAENYGTSLMSKAWPLAVLGLTAVVALWGVYRFRGSNKVFGRIWAVVDGIWQGVKSCMKMKSWWKFILLTLLVWACYWMMSVSVMWAVRGIDPSLFGPEMLPAMESLHNLNLTDAFFLMIAGSLSSLVPVPGGFGAFHYVLSLALSTMYGIPTEIGIIFATLSHESQTIIQMICGGMSWGYETLRKNV